MIRPRFSRSPRSDSDMIWELFIFGGANLGEENEVRMGTRR